MRSFILEKEKISKILTSVFNGFLILAAVLIPIFILVNEQKTGPFPQSKNPEAINNVADKNINKSVVKSTAPIADIKNNQEENRNKLQKILDERKKYDVQTKIIKNVVKLKSDKELIIGLKDKKDFNLSYEIYDRQKGLSLGFLKLPLDKYEAVIEISENRLLFYGEKNNIDYNLATNSYTIPLNN